MKEMLRLLLEHNPRHYVRIKLLGNEYKVCARCLGTYTGGVISFIIFFLLCFSGFNTSFFHIFVLSWVLALFCFFDWVTVKAHLRSGSNVMRIISGLCLGTAISMWFWLLPASWLYRITSLGLIMTVFSLIVFAVNYKEFKDGKFDKYYDFFVSPKRTYACDLGCCTTTCCLFPQYVCYAALICCCCCCPIALYLILRR